MKKTSGFSGMKLRVEEAAKYLRLSEHTIATYVTRGLLTPEKFGPLNVFTKAELDRYKRERNPRGRRRGGKKKR